MKFNIILADPPWPYDNPKDNNPAHGGKTYPVMTMDELKSLSIRPWVNKQCYLFMWVTMPKIKEGLELMSAWGFEFKTVAFTWLKTNPKNGKIYSGLGHYTNSNQELVFLGRTKGKMMTRINKNVKQVIVAPRGKHSEKPTEEIHKRIYDLLGDLPRLEMFAREIFNDGWKYWGNEIKSDIKI